MGIFLIVDPDRNASLVRDGNAVRVLFGGGPFRRGLNFSSTKICPMWLLPFVLKLIVFGHMQF
jgi:hypothetical protein